MSVIFLNVPCIAFLKICMNLVTKVLSIYRRLIEQLSPLTYWSSDLLENVITGDETWVSDYDSESKRQSFEWHTSALQRNGESEQVSCDVQAHHIFDIKFTVNSEFALLGQTVYSHFYLEDMKLLQGRVKHSRKNVANTYCLHHDNAPSHTDFIVTEILAKHVATTLPQPRLGNS
ncbi:putative DD34D transposase [Nephila pilipes]|uniref:Putative DD34D transposase n=1 Tax=Nephila pilipes TaxID=299642 RepID=A0A8X6Q3R1_NEPPI|nr:putative DD34D transposase [Nephila pilipes]